ncbi:MAG: 50S ribosomal protein L9 [Candidatus Magasanikbacteria bacterium]|nr:50S ribosomal protein L9 [Candidatus Magasanikbacteria bacterium]
MQVLLLLDLPGIGKKGEVKEAAEGYVRNFLLPQKKAILATRENLKKWQSAIDQQAREKQKQQTEIRKLANRLQGLTLEFLEKIDNKGHLFGGISTAHIATALSQKGLKVEKNQIILDKAIKQIGKYPVKIKLGVGLESEIKIIIKNK